MDNITSGIGLLRMTKNTLVAVNRTVMSVDPFYVKITWAGAAISSTGGPVPPRARAARTDRAYARSGQQAGGPAGLLNR